MNMLRATLIAVAFLCGSHAAEADSDGYFCVGPDYLAYQLNSPGFPGAHKLFVIPFDWDQTEIIRYTTDLPDFQVHDIICNEKHIRAIGWESVHDVTWDSDDLNALKVMSSKKVYVPPQYGDRSLPLSLVYGPDQAISLRDPNNRYIYVLEVSRKDIPELQCTELVTARLSKIDVDVLVDSIILVSHEVSMECGR
ncbi:MAG: hypothetical protein AAFV47_12440 [Pseudomonadota bacterium]